MNRGDQREDIFADDDDRRRFRSTLEEACTKTEWQVHAYCLMRNHFHLVVETPQANLVAGMKQAGPKHVGEETRQSDEAKAERIVQNQLNRLGWGPEELERHRTGEPRKVKIAARLRRQTTMTLAWIAERLRMGSPAHVAHLLYWQGRERKQ